MSLISGCPNVFTMASNFVMKNVDKALGINSVNQSEEIQKTKEDCKVERQNFLLGWSLQTLALAAFIALSIATIVSLPLGLGLGLIAITGVASLVGIAICTYALYNVEEYKQNSKPSTQDNKTENRLPNVKQTPDVNLKPETQMANNA